MENTLRFIAVLAILSLTIPTIAQTNAKFGYIDSNELIELMPSKDTVEAKLVEYQKSLERQIENMILEYQNKVQDVIENELPAINEMIKKDEKEIISIISREEFFEEK